MSASFVIYYGTVTCDVMNFKYIMFLYRNIRSAGSTD